MMYQVSFFLIWIVFWLWILISTKKKKKSKAEKQTGSSLLCLVRVWICVCTCCELLIRDQSWGTAPAAPSDTQSSASYQTSDVTHITFIARTSQDQCHLIKCIGLEVHLRYFLKLFLSFDLISLGVRFHFDDWIRSRKKRKRRCSCVSISLKMKSFHDKLCSRGEDVPTCEKTGATLSPLIRFDQRVSGEVVMKFCRRFSVFPSIGTDRWSSESANPDHRILQLQPLLGEQKEGKTVSETRNHMPVGGKERKG